MSSTHTVGVADAPTLEQIRGKAVVDVPTAGRLLDMSRSAAYRAAAKGHLPVIRLGENRVVVSVPKLLRMLEGEPAGDAA